MKSLLVTNHILQVRFYQLLQQYSTENHDRCIDAYWEAFELEFPGLLEFIETNKSFPEDFSNQNALKVFEYFYNGCEQMDYDSLYDSCLNLELNYYFADEDNCDLNEQRSISAFPILYDNIYPTVDGEFCIAIRNGCRTLHRTNGKRDDMPKKDWPVPIIQDSQNIQKQKWQLEIEEELKSFLDFVERTQSKPNDRT